MKIINIKYLQIILLVFILSCSGNIKNTNCEFNYSVKINNDIAVDKNELRRALSTALKQNRMSRYSVEIIVFGYSSGKEEYYYSENDNENIVTKTHAGCLEVLLKIRHNNILEKAAFINSYGNTIKENVNNLVKKISQELCE